MMSQAYNKKRVPITIFLVENRAVGRYARASVRYLKSGPVQGSLKKWSRALRTLKPGLLPPLTVPGYILQFFIILQAS